VVPDPPNPSERLTALQIIDVNVNRASEGLRVVEEYCRFVLSDARLTARCKGMRDQLHAAVDPICRQGRLESRDTSTDVGATREFAATARADANEPSLEQIAIRNGERVKEALRAIEEYAKLLDAKVARDVGMLRYQWYNLERDWQLRCGVSAALAGARLYILVDGGRSECNFAERIESLIEAGVHVIQLRAKSLGDRELLARARLARRIIDHHRHAVISTQYSVRSTDDASIPLTPFVSTPSSSDHHSPLTTHHSPLLIINDRPDIAVLSGADGVHLGQDDMEVTEARRIVGHQRIVGVSTHSIEQARQAAADGASYIGCGPTFPSVTKKFEHFPGLEFLRQVAAEIPLPAFAIGGITLENLPEVLATGFTRVAVGAAITAADDPATATRSFLGALGAIRGDMRRDIPLS
jgi:thiamine-phosphate pyrophosphorylase